MEVPPENWAIRKITNSAGLTGATPISTTTMPASIDSAVLFVSSHLTKNACSGLVPNRAPLRHSLTKNAEMVRRILPQSLSSLGSKTHHWVPCRIDSSR